MKPCGDNSTGHLNSNCPCGEINDKPIFVNCSKCEQRWHTNCCNLSGIDESAVRMLTGWKCPRCYSSPYVSPKQKSASQLTSSIADIKDKVGQMHEMWFPRPSRLSRPVMCFQPPDISVKTPLIEVNAAHSSSSFGLDLYRYIKDPSKPYVFYERNVVDQTLRNELMELTSSEQSNFMAVGEHQREILYYGIHSYRNGGHKFEPREMPLVINKLFDSIKHRIPLNQTVNSCLITRFWSSSSFVPLHQDDEPVIDSQSLILTVSLGSNRMMTFVSIDKMHREDILLEESSLLVTSRYSQDFWKHGYYPGDEASDYTHTGYSFKFRNIAPHFMLSY